MLIEKFAPMLRPDVVFVVFEPNDIDNSYLGLEEVVVDKSGYMTTKEASSLGWVGRFLFMNSHAFRSLWRVTFWRVNFRKASDRQAEIFDPDGN